MLLQEYRDTAYQADVRMSMSTATVVYSVGLAELPSLPSVLYRNSCLPEDCHEQYINSKILETGLTRYISPIQVRTDNPVRTKSVK